MNPNVIRLFALAIRKLIVRDPPNDSLQVNHKISDNKAALKMKLAHFLVLTLWDASCNIPTFNFRSNSPTTERERRREREGGSAPRM